MARLDLALDGCLLLAAGHAVGAAGVELAALGRVGGRGNGAFQHDAVHLDRRVRHGNGGEERLRVGVERITEDVRFRAVFHQVAEIHDADRVGDMLNHGQIVADEEIRQLVLILQLVEQVDDLRLNGHIERGDRLVADNELGIERERACNADTLALAAGELVRVAILVEGLKAAVVHDLVDIVVELFLGDEVMLAHGFSDDLADRHTRGKRGERILEDDLHLGAQRAQILMGEIVDLLPVEKDLTGSLAVVQAEDGAAGRRLAAAGLANETHGRAALEIERDAVHRLDMANGVSDYAALDGEILLQVVDLKDILRVILHGGKIGILKRIDFMICHGLFPLLIPVFRVVAVAADLMRGGEGDLVRILALAAVHAHFAAILKVTVIRHIDGVGNLAGDGVELIDLLADDRLGGHQTDGVGVGGMRKNLFRSSLLNNAAGVHDDHIIRHFGDNAEVVRDEHDGGVDAILQVAQQVENLRLNGHIQRGGRLIGNDELGAARKRHGDHNALAHTAGELVREHLVDALAVGDADHLQQLDGALPDLLLVVALLVVQGDDLIDLIADTEDRIQRGHRLLEDHGDHVAAQVLHDNVGRLGHIVGLVAEVQADLALHDLALRALQQLHNREAGDRLAAARFAHHADRLADRNAERDTVNRVDRADIGEEVGMQIFNFENVRSVLHGGKVLALGNILALVLLFQPVGDLAVFSGNAAGFLCGQIAVVFLSHSNALLP